MTQIPILYEDAEALVIDKPAGLPIDTPRKGGPSLSDHLEELKLNFVRAPTPVHRLDTDTSGCLLLARNRKAHPKFAAMFQARRVGKVYLGIVAGPVGKDSGTIELSLSKISSAEKGWRMIAARGGKEAVTHWTKLKELEGGLTLVEFRPETGRTHQIRVHALLGLGEALLSDPVYGKTDPRSPRTMLHASHIVMPRVGKPDIEVSAPLPADFLALGASAMEA